MTIPYSLDLTVYLYSPRLEILTAAVMNLETVRQEAAGEDLLSHAVTRTIPTINYQFHTDDFRAATHAEVAEAGLSIHADEVYL